ncbi:hypothetical protein A11A3_00970 [Alcanivorax hongdengensis A-11-3]|uniref:Uncharacterized protein n=1 Tax=Alcanivorax hongdengensis A-11-3 TaxID=1177179 RepID=L0WIN5_9GAMM|nr:hypothetical protein [Alcanivorax hongdengensis]EKF76022.1 hypothetical protein A11A3_00970 [Alcanivorax hongdengensis A-11-3]
MRPWLLVGLLLTTTVCQADDVLLLKSPPRDCQPLDDVSVDSGGELQGLFFSDAMIERNVHHALEKAVRKEGGNRTVIKDRRAYLMDNHRRGIRRIELKAAVWHCPPATD